MLSPQRCAHCPPPRPDASNLHSSNSNFLFQESLLSTWNSGGKAIHISYRGRPHARGREAGKLGSGSPLPPPYQSPPQSICILGRREASKLLFVSLLGDAGNSGSSFLRFLPAKSRRLLMATSHYCWCPQRKDKRVDVCLDTPLKTPGPSPFTEHFHPDKWDTNHVYLTANE